jgi:hypothetical protein
MPDFSSPQQPGPIKLLYLGHTGVGKTGSLCSLAAAGYNVRILDLEAGTDIIRDYLLNPTSPYRKASPGVWTQEQADTVLQRIRAVTITEQYLIQGTKAIPRGDAWMKMNGQLNNWIDGDDKPGNIAKWSENDVLVIDGLSQLSRIAMNWHLVVNNRAAEGPRVGSSGSNDYTAAYKMIRDFLDLLKSETIRCHVVMICHIRFIADADTASRAQTNTSGKRDYDLKGFPQTVGPMLSPEIGQYFNHTLRAKSIGSGPGVQRVIVTNNDESVDLKSSAPLRVKKQYNLGTGLAEYFRDVRGESS